MPWMGKGLPKIRNMEARIWILELVIQSRFQIVLVCVMQTPLGTGHLEKIYIIWVFMTTIYIMLTLTYIISME